MKRAKHVIPWRYLVFYVAMVGALLMIVLSIGYYYGPGHFGSSYYERGMADILLSGNNVFNTEVNYEEGLLQKYYVHGLSERRDVIVLASSRSMFVRDHLFPGRTFFNNFVSSATFQDYLAIYDLYRERGLIPSTVVIEASFSMLDGRKTMRWTSLQDEYSSMAAELGLAAAQPPRIGGFAADIRELLSWPYFKESLASLRDAKIVKYYSTKESTSSLPGRLYDGSLVDRWSHLPKEDTDRIADMQFNSDLEADRFTELDRQRMNELESFVQYLQENNVEVILFLPPYYPSVYDRLVQSESFGVVFQAEAYYRDMARASGITVVGSYDPQESSCTEEDFFDYHHVRESGVDKIFSVLD